MFATVTPKEYVCEHHGVIGENSGLSYGAPTITSSMRGHDGDVRCMICYWENVIIPNCGKVTERVSEDKA